MSDNNPNTPGGSVPPKPPEASKVQPKKETVRISLPPKPTSSPTIKLPTLPSGGPAAPSSSGAATPAPASGAPPAPRPPTAGAPALTTAAAAAAARPPTATGAPSARPLGAPGGPTAGAARRPAPVRGAQVSGLDVGLGVAAAVVGIGAAVCLSLLLNLK